MSLDRDAKLLADLPPRPWDWWNEYKEEYVPIMHSTVNMIDVGWLDAKVEFNALVSFMNRADRLVELKDAVGWLLTEPTSGAYLEKVQAAYDALDKADP